MLAWLAQNRCVEPEWVEKQVTLRVDECSSVHSLSVFCGSWNVNGRKPAADEDLSPWFRSAWANGGSPDLVAVGFQEIVDLNAKNLLVDRSASSEWEKRIEECLNAGLQVRRSRN